jgi:hypothetical protein
MLAHPKESALWTEVPTRLSIEFKTGGEGRVEEPRQMRRGSEQSDATTHGF